LRRSLTLVSPAKLNLILRVVGKRPDGYHEIVTLFHRISLSDTLRLHQRNSGIRLICSHPRVPKNTNLIVRAFHLLKARYPFSGGVTVRLTKRIPVGGGLGGGSSNAAAFLRGMNWLFRLGLTTEELVDVGKALGADVPFFMSEARQAIGRGRGDEIQPLPFKRRLWFVLVPGTQGLSTRDVYSGLRGSKHRLSLTRVNYGVKLASAFLEKGSPSRAERFLGNDLQGRAERIQPSLRKRRERLSGLQLGTCQMSGSGPTLFILFPSPQKAVRALRQIQRHPGARAAVLCHSF